MGGVAWTEQEDHRLRKCIQQYGEGKWDRVPLLAGLNRCPKSCRLRWLNYLRPNIKRGSFAEEEAEMIVKLHKLLGNRWSLIAGRLPGRTANDVKNSWNCHLSKKLIAQEREIVGRNAQVIRPQPGNTASSSVKGKSNRAWRNLKARHLQEQVSKGSVGMASSPRRRRFTLMERARPCFNQRKTASIHAWWTNKAILLVLVTWTFIYVFLQKSYIEPSLHGHVLSFGKGPKFDAVFLRMCPVIH